MKSWWTVLVCLALLVGSMATGAAAQAPAAPRTSPPPKR